MLFVFVPVRSEQPVLSSSQCHAALSGGQSFRALHLRRRFAVHESDLSRLEWLLVVHPGRGFLQPLEVPIRRTEQPTDDSLLGLVDGGILLGRRWQLANVQHGDQRDQRSADEERSALHLSLLFSSLVSSLEIHNSRVSEEQKGSTLVSCSVSILRSTFQSTELSTSGTANLPRLNLFLSTRTPMSEEKFTNESLSGQNFTRTITFKRPLTRADDNGTLQCQVESNNNLDVYLIRSQMVDFQCERPVLSERENVRPRLDGPNLEAGALAKVQLESETMKKTEMECQIEGNPTPSYVWYEISSNISTGSTLAYQPAPVGQSVFGNSRQIERFYQYPGQYVMQCQAQANGKTIRQEFLVAILRKCHERSRPRRSFDLSVQLPRPA